MDKSLILEKFGGNYLANEDTYHMGVHTDLADQIAKRFIGHQICVDACLGAGFMTLALVKYVEKVIGVDINLEHLKQAKENIKIAGLEGKVEFIEGDIIQAVENLKEIDSAFLDPDWAKVGDSKENHVSELRNMVPNGDVLLEKVFKKTQNVCLRLPKEFDLNKLADFPPHESQPIYQNGKLKFYCIYFGDLRNKND